MPFKTFTASVLSSSDMNTYVMKQAVITCTSGTRPSSPVQGMMIYETDNDLIATYNGSAWVYSVGGWTTAAPTLTAVTTNPTLGTGSSTLGRYSRTGKTITYEFIVQFGTSGANAGSGAYEISLPVTAATPLSGSIPVGVARIQAAGSTTLGQCYLNATSATTKFRVYYNTAATAGTLTAVSNANPGAFTNNDLIAGTIVYEAA